MNKTIVGFLQYSLSKEQWLSENTSMSWLRILELLSKLGYETHAVCEENSGGSYCEHNGVKYHFLPRSTKPEIWINKIEKLSPNLLFVNNCPTPWHTGEVLTKYFKNKGVKQVLRNHFEPSTAFRNSKDHTTLIPNNVDHIISSFDIHYDFLSKNFHIENQNFSHCPFCINTFVEPIPNSEKDFDFMSSSCPTRSLKNGELVTEVFDILKSDGYTAINPHSINRQDFHNYLKRGKVFYFPSLTEGTGRSLLEAVAFGQTPVVDSFCQTTCYIAKQFGGFYIDSGSKTDSFKNLGHSKSPRAIANELIEILKKHNAKKDNPKSLSKFDISFEISRVASILIENLK